ncbi:BnaC09g00990D [Brassica napus]|uniref:Auxin response factor n=1 Tax=Brassica napus TaxID=3708 RepID=A0A078GBD4_BRANA|nr:BnaC09g00990D [Brassica napus]
MANNQIMNAQPKFRGTEGVNRYLYDQLWKLCAGSLFDLPIIGEEVYYFPQGHIEQLVASANDNLCQLKPIFDISSRIHCNVVSIKLRVETNTDEVYAKVSLLPCPPEVEIPFPNDNNEQNIKYFTKVLTASDIGPHGDFILFKKDAIECLPPLDMSQLIPSQEIAAKDLHDHVWKFKHTFRGTPKRHLFTSGWKEFVKGKNLTVGDSFVFLRGENGESRVGIRKASHQQSDMSSSVISKESMHHGFIASASNAIHTKCMFDVFYKPKSSKFIVNCDKFLDAVNRKLNTSSRFTMKFEGHDFNEIIYSGTIVKVEDFSIYWKDSEWRNLQVQWDEAATIPRPNKVSPWEIEPLIPSSNILKSVIRNNKRQREINEFVSYAGPIISKPDYNDQMVQSTKENSTTNASSSFRLFGVDLTASTKARDVLEPLESYQKNKTSEIFEEENLDQIQAVTSLTEIQRKEISFTTSSTKVHMEGVVRTVDLTVFNGYNHMIVELEKLFNIEGKLHMHSQWKLTFKDHEGDMMLVGDDPWPKFCNIVKEIVISSK